MDWDHICSLVPEDLTEDEKEELYNSITWFDNNGEDLTNKQLDGLFRISQELLKFKGEQVEILLQKLDDIATQQGEDEIKRSIIESDTDAKSSKSRKSSSIEYENLEYKYLELKSKFKKQMKTNDKNLAEITKLKKKITDLEEDNYRLAHELEILNQDDRSDISETVKEQHKELVESLQTKNKQISRLLADIQDVENENSVLREELMKVRDELSATTKEIKSLTDNFNDARSQLIESTETVKKLTAENEALQDEFREILEDKQRFEEETEKFTEQVNRRVDEWKKILDDKDRVIQELKSQRAQASLHSSLSSLPQDQDDNQVVLLNRLLSEREQQLFELKSRLQQAIKEMDDTTVVIKELTKEKEINEIKINDLTDSIIELKKQLKTTHERCQELHDNLNYTEKKLIDKDNEIRESFNKLRKNGQIELADCFEEISNLKDDNRNQEKQIIDLVKVTNQLQENCDRFEQENETLRDRLGLKIDDKIDTTLISLKRKKQKKELSTIRRQLAKLEDENLELKTTIHEQNRKIITIGDCQKLTKVEDDSGEELKSLVEENEALRRGLHEILDSINTKKQTSLEEIKSETLERLLRALDVKHISGWYHPAMRLQAELHNQEGITAELREQLRLTRLELKSQKSEDSERLKSQDSDILKDFLINNDTDSLSNIHNHLQNLLEKLEKETTNNSEIEIKLTEYKTNLLEIRQQIQLLYDEYLEKTENYNTEMVKSQEKVKELQELSEIKEEKIKILTNKQENDDLNNILTISENNVILKRKNLHLENDNEKLTRQLTKLQNNLDQAQIISTKKLNDLVNKNKSLTIQIETINSTLEQSIPYKNFEELQKNFDNSTLKYRQLLNEFEQINNQQQIELKILEESNRNLENDKNELKNKLIVLYEKIHAGESNGNLEDLSKKLAEIEISEISERQRANHTNNLYELIREQLQKFEDKYRELEDFNKEILNKNQLLQEQYRDLERKLCNFIGVEEFQQIQSKYNQLLVEYGEFKAKCREINGNLPDKGVNFEELLRKDNEILMLKHQIVDLQSTTDDKHQIARLNNEIANLQQNLNELNQKYRDSIDKLQQYEHEKQDFYLKLQNQISEHHQKENDYKNRLQIFKDLLEKQKSQYLGSIPLVSQEKFIDHLRSVINEKYEVFVALNNAKNLIKDGEICKEHYENELKNLEKLCKLQSIDIKEVFNNLQEKRTLQFNELKYRRQSEMKDKQLQHIFNRVKRQDEQIMKLEEELFQLHQHYNISSLDFEADFNPNSTKIEDKNIEINPPIVLTKTKETQTIETNEHEDDKIINLQQELLNVQNDINEKDQLIQQLKNKIAENDSNISLFRKQLGDKQSQITFYEKHILELQVKKDGSQNGVESGEITSEIMSLKTLNKSLQDNIKEKDEEILKYQSLLKEDRDKHNLAASLMRKELRILQKCLNEEKQKYLDLKSSISELQPNRQVLEQYFVQVRCLEGELQQLRTKVPSLETQLQASREEAVRWRTLANDRLESMQKLGNDLEEIHRNEILAYKNDSEKWREEVNHLKQTILKYRNDQHGDFDLKNLIKQKDDKIHELTVMLRQIKSEHKKPDKIDLETVQKLTELESAKEQLVKEHESIKKRFNQLLNRERSAREEIRELRAKLMRKPTVSARSDRSDRSIKDQLQKKIASLENEIVDLKDNLQKQININELHKVKIAEDFERWNKQKHWQQTAEKLKEKLKQKESDFEKLQQTCSGYRILIERLEREKSNMENKLRHFKMNFQQNTVDEIEILRSENVKLLTEIESLNTKLTMQQHQSGALGAAMLQEKLEAQERKIALLELAAKGPVEMRSELERLQNTIATLQKTNLSLEADNLDLKLDLEKLKKETPHLREQVQHLENYIEILKNENVEKDDNTVDSRSTSKRISELERTIFVLKRVVEKLQVENKRLTTGKRPYPERCISDSKLRDDYQRLKEQYLESLQKIASLEDELKDLRTVQSSDSVSKLKELDDIRGQLEQKNTLLDKVRVLLHRAAIKEKTLLREIARLKGQQETSIEEASELPETPEV